jgi:DNA-binding transcriptional LysR family regulator
MTARPAGHPLADRAEPPAAEVAGQREILHLCAGAGTGAADRVSAVRTAEEELEYVAAGRGVTYLPRSAALLHHGHVVHGPVAGLPPGQVAPARAAGHPSALVDDFTAVALRTARAAAG